MNEIGPNKILTRFGQWVDSLDVAPEDVRLDDIAAALAKQCRFNGHTKSFYSVAQHSIEVSHRVPKELAAWGLMHDAAEAYLGDVVRPLKQSLIVDLGQRDPTRIPDVIYSEQLQYFTTFETVALCSVFKRFGLLAKRDDDFGAKIHEVDGRMLVTEMRDLFDPPADYAVAHLGEPYPERVVPMDWIEAEAEFLHRARELGVG